jgi:outer membrane protein OmpA-like peptidoglycan-associated protein
VIEGLVKGIFEGVDILAKDPDRVAALMAQGYGFPVDECKGMLGDAYATGLGDNARFFLSSVADNKTNFVGTWNSAVDVYKRYGAISQGVTADEVMDASVIQKLQEAGEFRHQGAQEREFSPLSVDIDSIEAGEDDVLRVPKRIAFKPNKWDLDAKYDETIPTVVAEIKELSQRYAGARIIIEGNVDTSKKNQIRRLGQRQFAIMSQAVQELSEKRAEAVRQALLEDMPEEDKNRFVAFGNGWDNPIDLLDHSKNRRVDVRVIRLE